MSFTGQLGTSSSKPGNVVPGYSSLLLLTAGFSAGATLVQIQVASAGLAAGAFGNTRGDALSSVNVGSVATGLPSLLAGVAVGSAVSTPTQFGGVVVAGLLVGSAGESDSGDLANGRYRR